MSYVFAIFNIAYGVFEIPSGWIGDRYGQRTVLTRIVAGWSICTGLTGSAQGFWSLFATRFWFGAAEAGAFPNFARALGRWYPVEQRARVQGILWTGARLGGAFAPPAMVALMEAIGWRLSFWVLCGVGMLWCAAFWRGYSDQGPVAVSSEALRKTPWGRILRSRNLWALFGMYFATSYGFYFFITWLPTYLLKEHGLTLAQSGMYSFAPLAAGAVGCMLGGVLSDWLVRLTGSLRWGRAAVGILAYVMGAMGFLIANFAHGPVAVVGALAFAQGAMDLALPVSWATSVDIGGPYGATVSAYMNTASSISAALSPVSAAWLAGRFGSFRGMFLTVAAVYVTAAILWLFIDPTEPLLDDKEPIPCESQSSK